MTQCWVGVAVVWSILFPSDHIPRCEREEGSVRTKWCSNDKTNIQSLVATTGSNLTLWWLEIIIFLICSCLEFKQSHPSMCIKYHESQNSHSRPRSSDSGYSSRPPPTIVRYNLSSKNYCSYKILFRRSASPESGAELGAGENPFKNYRSFDEFRSNKQQSAGQTDTDRLSISVGIIIWEARI